MLEELHLTAGGRRVTFPELIFDMYSLVETVALDILIYA